MSDILIKNMEMPNMCYPYCPFCDDRGDYPLCIITGTQKGYRFIEENARMEDCPLISIPEHGDLIARGWHLGEPSENEQGWFLTMVMVRDCDGTFFPEYEACFKYEEWVGRRHRQPVVAYQLIEPTEDSLCEEKK